MIVAAYETKERSQVLAEGHCARVIIADENNHCAKYFEQRLEKDAKLGLNLSVTDTDSVEPMVNVPSFSAV